METKKPSIPKPAIEDALLPTTTSCNAESMVDQTRMTRVHKLMSDAQVLLGDHTIPELDLNSESPEKVGLKERLETTFGDHLLLTTSGITTTVLKLFAET
jgi:hypothetical protein